MLFANIVRCIHCAHTAHIPLKKEMKYVEITKIQDSITLSSIKFLNIVYILSKNGEKATF